jgi:excisionase family DNA binding protein
MGEIAKPAPSLISVSQAAKLAAVAPVTIYRRVHAGEIPAVRVGNDGHGPIRIPRQAFTEWLFGDEAA